jgi:hypothetical protein
MEVRHKSEIMVITRRQVETKQQDLWRHLKSYEKCEFCIDLTFNIYNSQIYIYVMHNSSVIL